MSHLTPCLECQRHVRTTETRCPFCGHALSLSHLPEPVLPRSRLGRAATFAFGATLAGATVLSGCGGESESKKPGTGGAGSGGTASGGSASGGSASGGSASGGSASGGSASGGSASGGSASGGAASGGVENAGGTGIAPPYGVPPGGSFNDTGGTTSGGFSAAPMYGAPAAGSGNSGGNPGVPPK